MAKEQTYFDGNRLKEGREARALSITQLAEKLSGAASKQSISLYEKNKQAPPFDVLDQIASVLQLPIRFFMPEKKSRKEEAVFPRSRSSVRELSLRSAERKLAWLERIVGWLEDYFDFTDVNVRSLEKGIDPLALTDEQIEEHARMLREHWKLGIAPVPNVAKYLEASGVMLGIADLGEPTLDGISGWKGERPYMLVNRNTDSPGRRRLSLAHELGHAYLHRYLSRSRFVENYRKCENQAYRFGSAFLLPPEFAQDVFKPTLEVFSLLKSKWRVSIAAMIHRYAELGWITKDEATRLWIQYSKRGYRQRGEPFDNEIPMETATSIQFALMELVENQDVDVEEILASIPLNVMDIEELSTLPPRTLALRMYTPVTRPTMKESVKEKKQGYTVERRGGTSILTPK